MLDVCGLLLPRLELMPVNCQSGSCLFSGVELNTGSMNGFKELKGSAGRADWDDILYPLAIRHLYRDEFDLAKRYALDSRVDALAEGDQVAAEQATQIIEEIDSHAA